MGIKSDILIQVPKEKKHITGEIVKGIVRFTLKTDTVFSEISLSLVAKSYCSWVHPLRGKVSGSEVFVVTKMYLINTNTKLNAGSYENDFQIAIPENVSPSVKTSVGEIKYHLVLKFKKPRTFSSDKTFNTNIKIYPRIDSKISHEALGATLEKILWEMLASKTQADISIQAVLDKEYFIPGGERNIAFFVNNYSDVSFAIKAELICKTVYKIPDHDLWLDREKVITFSKVVVPNIPDKSVSSWTKIIPVPPDICTVRYSAIMQREYVLRVTMKLPIPHTNTSIEIPVFVGEDALSNYVEAGEFHGPMEDPQSQWQNMYEDE